MTRELREARIDLGAVTSNLAALRAATAPAATMAVVKADAYGHGAIRVAEAAVDAGVEWLGVADIPEALALRRAGIRIPVLAWLHGSAADFEAAATAGVDIGVSTRGQLERAAATSGLAQVQLKVDTGLSRNGVGEDDRAEFFERAAELEKAGRLRVRGIFSHLSNTSDADDLEQSSRFESSLGEAAQAGLSPEVRHLAATAGALRHPGMRFDLVRIGIGMYGLSPFESIGSAELGLRPAMELSAEIVSVKRVRAGAGLSYGYTHRTSAESTVALVPLGYADGIPRAASSRGPVVINGRRYVVSGRVAMDQFIIDLGGDRVAVGDRAVLFGDPAAGIPSVEEWAVAAHTINYEIVTRIGSRVHRVYRS